MMVIVQGDRERRLWTLREVREVLREYGCEGLWERLEPVLYHYPTGQDFYDAIDIMRAINQLEDSE